MAGVRIADLETEVEEVVEDDFLPTDNVLTSTAKIKAVNFISQITRDVLAFNEATITYVASDKFLVNSYGYLKYSVSPTLEDGYKITFTASGLTTNFQPRPDITINVDGTGYKPVINGVYYDFNPYDPENDYSSQLLDKNTIGNGRTTLVFSALLDKWLLYKEDVLSGTIIGFPHTLGRLAGSLRLSKGEARTQGDYPIFEMITGITDGSTIELDNTSLAGYGDETPIGVVSQGQMEEFGFTGTIEGSFKNINYSNTNTATGDYSQGASSYTPVAQTNYDTTSTYTITQNTTVTTTANTGKETLTRRYGLQYYWVL